MGGGEFFLGEAPAFQREPVVEDGDFQIFEPRGKISLELLLIGLGLVQFLLQAGKVGLMGVDLLGQLVDQRLLFFGKTVIRSEKRTVNSVIARPTWPPTRDQ